MYSIWDSREKKSIKIAFFLISTQYFEFPYKFTWNFKDLFLNSVFYIYIHIYIYMFKCLYLQRKVIKIKIEKIKYILAYDSYTNLT